MFGIDLAAVLGLGNLVGFVVFNVCPVHIQCFAIGPYCRSSGSSSCTALLVGGEGLP